MKPMLVGSLKLPGLSSTSDNEQFEENIKNMEDNNIISQESSEHARPRIEDPEKQTTRSNKNPLRSKIQPRSNKKVTKEINTDTPLFPGKLVPVYIYRHGRRLPVTSFRPYVPPPPPKKGKKNLLMSMESVLVADLKLPFLVIEATFVVSNCNR